MQTLNSLVKNPSGWDSPSNYIGESDFPGWYVLVTQTRDSDCLARSNFRSALEALGGEQDDQVEIFRFGHWACGWWEALAVKESSPAFVIAEEIYEALQDYPIVDEEDFSALENEKAQDVWTNCYNDKKRLAYIREHRSQFSFQDFAQLLQCVRGKTFLGYASELLH